VSSASAAAKTPAVLRRYGTGVIPTPGSKSVPRSRERLLDVVCRRDACAKPFQKVVKQPRRRCIGGNTLPHQRRVLVFAYFLWGIVTVQHDSRFAAISESRNHTTFSHSTPGTRTALAKTPWNGRKGFRGQSSQSRTRGRTQEPPGTGGRDSHRTELPEQDARTDRPGGHERPGLPAVKTHRRTQSQPRRTEAQRAPEAEQRVLRPSCRADR
jgi:hypothetical protein